MAVMMRLICVCAKSSASATVSSLTSRAPASTITIASSLPTTTMFSRLVFCSATVGLATSWPFSKPTRTAAMGCTNGRSEQNDAADAPVTAITSGSISLSAESTMATICVSLRQAAGNLSGGVGVLAVVHGEGKKIAVIYGCGHARRDQHDGIAVARHDGAVGLSGDFAGFQDERASAHVDLDLMRGRQMICFWHNDESFRSLGLARSYQVRRKTSAFREEEKARQMQKTEPRKTAATRPNAAGGERCSDSLGILCLHARIGRPQWPGRYLRKLRRSTISRYRSGSR